MDMTITNAETERDGRTLPEPSDAHALNRLGIARLQGGDMTRALEDFMQPAGAMPSSKVGASNSRP